MIRLIAFAAFVCLVSCDRKSNAKAPSEVSPILSAPEVAQIGFATKAVRAVSQSKWDQDQFGSASIVEQDIKSTAPMADQPSLFPRYTIIRETYENPELADSRLKRLRDHDPGLDDKIHSGLVLRDGFATGKDVWIVTTDAVIFSHLELGKVKGNLEELKNAKAGALPVAR